MILNIEDIWTAIEKGYETMASLQLSIAKRSRVSGSPNIYNKKQLVSLQLYANVSALEELALGHDILQNGKIKKIYSTIKLITKDIRRWD